MGLTDLLTDPRLVVHTLAQLAAIATDPEPILTQHQALQLRTQQRAISSFSSNVNGVRNQSNNFQSERCFRWIQGTSSFQAQTGQLDNVLHYTTIQGPN